MILVVTSNARTRRFVDAALERGASCFWCSAEVFRAPPPERVARLATADHYLVRSRGGTDAFENLRLACFSCNQARADLSAEAWAAWLSTAHGRHWSRVSPEKREPVTSEHRKKIRRSFRRGMIRA